MGLYLEPAIDKKDWLDQNGDLEIATVGVSSIDYRAVPDTKVLVCCVDNGYFYAAAVAYNESEFIAFDHPDGRPKYWYTVDKSKAKGVSPMWDTYMKG